MIKYLIFLVAFLSSSVFFANSCEFNQNFNETSISNCDYCNVFRLRSRSSGRFLSVSKDNYTILNLPDDTKNSYSQGDLWVQCEVDGLLYLRSWHFNIGYLYNNFNNKVSLDEEAVPGYVLIKESTTNTTLNSYNYTFGLNLYFTPVDPGNIYTHFSKISVDHNEINTSLFYESYEIPKEYCGEEKRAFRLLNRMTGKALFVKKDKKLALAYLDDNLEENNIISGSDVWTQCYNNLDVISIVKNLGNEGGFIHYDNVTNELYVSKELSNTPSFVLGDDQISFLGYYKIGFDIKNETYYLASVSDSLKLQLKNESDLYSDWNRQLLDI